MSTRSTSVTLTITNITKTGYKYDASQNHGGLLPAGSSSLTINK